MKHKIIILGCYPINPAIHGGQKRITAILDKYQQLGHEVKYISICSPGYTKYSDYDFLVNNETIKTLGSLPNPTFSEIKICQEAINDSNIVKKIKNSISTFNPTIVIYEQGYVYTFIKNFPDQLGLLGLPIIFSSQNVEWIMKKDIALSSGCSEKEIEPYINEIKEMERELLEISDYTLAVTQNDADLLKQLCSSANIIVVQNGINRPNPTEKAINFWKQFYQKHQIKRKIVYVGSDHPPNLLGFINLIDGVGFLPYQDKIIIAGGVCNAFKRLCKDSEDLKYSTFKNRIILTGVLGEEYLQGLIATADVIILPILVGGGSNLKTAEAIISEKPIVTTSCALRGYDKFLHFANIYIADNPQDFQNKILQALDTLLVVRNKEEKLLSSQVLWDYCLKPLDYLF